MTSRHPEAGRHRSSEPRPLHGPELAEALHHAARAARQQLGAVAAAVYLLDEHQGELRLALAGGSAPSFFTFPGKMKPDSVAATARAWASGRAAVLIDPEPADPAQQHALPYPYAAASAPVTAGERRFGALTVLRLETAGPFPPRELSALEKIGGELARALEKLADEGVTVAAGPMPMLVPPDSKVDTSVSTPGWGVRSVPGSAGTSMMYPLRRLADLLNRATTVDDVVRAAQYCVMAPLRARSLALVSASEGRLWVLGHSGDSSTMVRGLHGVSVDERTPAAQALGGRPLFVHDVEPPGPGLPVPDEQPRTVAYLPLTDDGQFIDLPLTSGRRVVGVCCLTFDGMREFPPEERALLGMMTGQLGAAVERVELSARQRAVAECLQRFLLPPQLADLPRLPTTARYRPAGTTSNVGGDWYDVITLPGECAVLVVGDVEGHAMESAAVMGQVRTAMASYAAEGHRPATVIDRTGCLLARLGTDLTVTCCVVALDTMDGTAEVALAGHPAPLLRTPDGNIRTLDAPANVPLGVTVPDPYQAREHALDPGSILMLWTNGLVDWHPSDPQTRAHVLLGSGESGSSTPDLEHLADRIITEACATQQPRDDAVVLLARYEGTPGQEEPRVAGLHIQRRDLLGARTARSFVHDQLDAWGLQDLSDTLELVASEIVTNALIHAGSDVDVRLRAFEDHLRLEVRDSDSNPPVPSRLTLAEEENARAEHGRGLLIVESLVDDWNSSPNGKGKTIALNLPIPAR
ncbi:MULTISPECIES: SpoIIE family protein phosphatase [Streptomyces]|uniref:SpoIIE family protein phosphatase n=1 Tax=Streptomyces TaxID=1883 RepID=UPI000B25BE3C|nr:SpoIIE family protein phosphatase [Streptomyces sp. AS58]